LNATHAAAAAAPTSATTYAIDPAASAIHYHIVHKLHRVTGRSQGAQGKAAIQDGGKVVAVVLVPASSFRSGDDDRDARVREILGSRGVSFVIFKGEGQLPEPVRGAPVELSPGGFARVQGSFAVSLDAHEIQRPSLLFVRIEDTCRIDVDLVLRDERR
jgi:hypothetical protein